MAQAYVVAVSGGVDSVVLLDMLVKIRNEKSQEFPELIVAHFEHGIRGEESQFDAEFVKNLSQKYRLKFEIGYGNLTQNSSEDTARRARYKFLRDVAKKHHGQLVTAHHADDFIGSVAINLQRGTGWRGLAVMHAADIVRPLRRFTKADVLAYATREKLEFVEDATNRDPNYLRNRLRAGVVALSVEKRAKIMALIAQQKTLAERIESEAKKMLATQKNPEAELSRYFLTMIDEVSALELLQTFFRQQFSTHLPRPILRRLLFAIKTLPIGRQHDVSGQLRAAITSRGATIRKGP